MNLLSRSYILIVIICLCCNQNRVVAQSSYYVEEPKIFTAGLLFGGNISQIDGDSFAGYSKVGINTGAIVYTRFAEHVSGSLEILYSQKGSKATASIMSAYGIVFSDYKINLNYAEIPVMINYVDKRRMSFGIGLSYSRLAISKETVTLIPYQVYDQTKYPFKKSDLNMVIGGNIHVWQGLFLNVRFQYSLLSIRDKVPQSDQQTGQYNNMWVVRFMYLFM